ncbi:uncharacterized protein zgc:194621 isoform X1 [Thunnus maccoyii]|uniref:uncharacterized protein zgc:194621 isoform X1 n=1 Tax=Thunnus maccoyii TaxID=8240 RepID=UPI001C4C04E9|nr:uncharacterized protein zgc:194621 isoform X1 [Thunnus maccoyii]XP_042255469.1 uncharacterized protein zgc:194621 isoform X1 [Thunnus maccoyii]
MPETKVIKPKPVEATRKTIEKTKPVKVRATNGAESDLRVPAVRKSRAASCPRFPQRGRCTTGAAGAQGAASKTNCERRARSSSTAPRLTSNWPRTNPDYRKASTSVNHAAGNPKCREMSGCPGQREQRAVRAEAKHVSQSHKAFTVIPPNPKKRREIQRKAEAELAALEELRLSRAMAYVSINPSSVGGCMSLEEVRLKQQQEMMQARRRKPQQVKKQLVEQTSVFTS